MNKLDNIDHKILRILQNDGRITTKELASKLHLTNTPVYERVRKLEKSGIIEKYVAILNPEKLNRNMVSFIDVNLQKHTKEAVDNFRQAVLTFPEVVEFHNVTGEYDVHLKIMVNDMAEFKIFIEEKLSGLDYVNTFHSSFAISSETKTGFDI
ncbi:MAG: winged helix-turn-helix transcriptional regulator [Bacteroidales bacterium]|nr:winged helix-turn-helix transcriptional regulator [Bacteroidales bacterium]